MKTRSIIVLGLGLAVLPALVFGQNAPLQARQKMRENITTLRLLRLTQALDLSEEQAAKIFPSFNRIEKEKLEIQKKMSGDIVGLRKLLLDPSAREGDMEVLLKSLREGRKAARLKDDELEGYIEASLTTAQKAKYLLFEIEFYRGLTDVLNRAGGMRRGQMGGALQPPIKK